MRQDEQITVSVTVKNSGKYDGEEIVQLYIRDLVASVVRPVKELKDFKKISLKAGESQVVRFVIDRKILSFYSPQPSDSRQMNLVAEPGDFNIMIGASSKDIRLTGTIALLD